MRIIKGIFIGSGFILPGVSGGALAAVFGIYERLINFLSNLKKDFVKNLLFFIPVGIGGLLGILLFSKILSSLLGKYEVFVLWFFIGCILGTLPTLFKQANKKGHEKKHLILMAVVAVVAFVLFKFLASASLGTSLTLSSNLILRTLTWVLVGAVIGLGTVVPGLSPSNILFFLGFYEPMLAGFNTFDLTMMLPLFLGMFLCVISLSKVMSYFFKKAYTGVYFSILGIVISSTVMIVPQYNYLSLGALICLVCAGAGALLTYGMTLLEDKYKPEDEF